MRIRSIVLALVIAAVSSLATWQWAAAQGAQRPTPDAQVMQIQSAIRSGADIGFRVDSVGRNKAMGRLVVRVNGQWVDAEQSVRFTPLQH